MLTGIQTRKLKPSCVKLGVLRNTKIIAEPHSIIFMTFHKSAQTFSSELEIVTEYIFSVTICSQHAGLWPYVAPQASISKDAVSCNHELQSRQHPVIFGTSISKLL